MTYVPEGLFTYIFWGTDPQKCVFQDILNHPISLSLTLIFLNMSSLPSYYSSLSMKGRYLYICCANIKSIIAIVIQYAQAGLLPELGKNDKKRIKQNLKQNEIDKEAMSK